MPLGIIPLNFYGGSFTEDLDRMHALTRPSMFILSKAKLKRTELDFATEFKLSVRIWSDFDPEIVELTECYQISHSLYWGRTLTDELQFLLNERYRDYCENLAREVAAHMGQAIGMPSYNEMMERHCESMVAVNDYTGYWSNDITTGSAITTDYQVWNQWCNDVRIWVSNTASETSATNVYETYSSPTNLVIQTTGTTDSITGEQLAVWTSTQWCDPQHARRLWHRPQPERRIETPQEIEQRRFDAEQRRRRARQEEARHRREREERKEQQRLARGRAKNLLLSMLSPRQKEELLEKKHFHLTVLDRKGGERRYRIDEGRAGNVKLLGADGVVERSYCIHGPWELPYEDHMLSQKLLLETNEKEFLKIANETILRRQAAS